MSSPDPYEARLTALEEKLSRVAEAAEAARTDAAAARILAAGAHGDVADFKAVQQRHTQVINGWGEQLNARLNGVSTRIDGLETEMREGFSTLATGMAQITALLKGQDEPGDDSAAGQS